MPLPSERASRPITISLPIGRALPVLDRAAERTSASCTGLAGGVVEPRPVVRASRFREARKGQGVAMLRAHADLRCQSHCPRGTWFARRSGTRNCNGTKRCPGRVERAASIEFEDILAVEPDIGSDR